MNLQVGVKVILINEHDEYLLLCRSQSMSHGGEKVWDIPGGRIEPSEGLTDALAREVSEETGLSLIGQPRLLAAQDIFVEAKQLHVVRLTYIGQAEGTTQLSDEHDSYQWMTKQDISDMGENLDPYLREVLKTI